MDALTLHEAPPLPTLTAEEEEVIFSELSTAANTGTKEVIMPTPGKPSKTGKHASNENTKGSGG